MSYLTYDPIDASQLAATLSDRHLGGTVMFVGSVRRGPEDGPVASIEYTAYERMAESEFAAVVGEVSERWPQVRLAMQHRLGTVLAGESGMVVVAAAPHRAEAFEACQFVITEVKRRMPIWKREVLDDGEARWANDNTASQRS